MSSSINGASYNRNLLIDITSELRRGCQSDTDLPNTSIFCQCGQCQLMLTIPEKKAVVNQFVGQDKETIGFDW